ncbi:MAG: glycosyltransferase family 4 protein [Ferruginibacter sp.]
MKIVSTSYTNTKEFNDPQAWLQRIDFYTGILEALSKYYEVESIEQIHYSGLLQCKGVKYHFLNFEKSILYFPWQLHDYIKKLKPHIILVNGFIFPLQIIQLRLKLGKTVKIIVINHAEKPATGIRKFLQQQADRVVDKYFFTAKEMGVAWVQCGIIADVDKIAEVMEASSVFGFTDMENALSRTGATGEPVFLWVGRLDENKDPCTVIKAFGAFLKQQPTAKLYMIYHTDELLDEIKMLCKKGEALNNAVTMVGKVPHKEMGYWYNSADFIIAASHYEGSGVAVCEAMSCGCIPLLSNIPSFNKMTGYGKCGLLFEPGNDGALLNILLQTLTTDIEKEKTKTLQQFKAELSFEAIAKKIERVIVSLEHN